MRRCWSVVDWRQQGVPQALLQPTMVKGSANELELASVQIMLTGVKSSSTTGPCTKQEISAISYRGFSAMCQELATCASSSSAATGSSTRAGHLISWLNRAAPWHLT